MDLMGFVWSIQGDRILRLATFMISEMDAVILANDIPELARGCRKGPKVGIDGMAGLELYNQKNMGKFHIELGYIYGCIRAPVCIKLYK